VKKIDHPEFQDVSLKIDLCDQGNGRNPEKGKKKGPRKSAKRPWEGGATEDIHVDSDNSLGKGATRI